MDSDSRGEGGLKPATPGSEELVQTREGCEITREAFQELLIVRKAEKKRAAEEERLKGLRRIAEMKSRQGIHPLFLFPKEIWTNILSEVTATDRANMDQLHPVFRGLMNDHKIRDIWLPLVLERNLLHKLDRDQFLGLRLVSKSVRNTVDKLIENHVISCTKNLSIFAPHVGSKHFRATDSKVVSDQFYDIHAFTRGPIIERPRRFLLRSLKLEFSSFRRSNNLHPSQIWWEGTKETRARRFQNILFSFNEQALELVKEVGHQILHVDLLFEDLHELDSLGVSISQIYGILREFLLLMPNLKWLVISILLFENTLSASCKQRDWIADTQLALSKDPVPRLNKLERVDWWGWKACPIWNAVLTANPHVKYHRFDGISDGRNEDGYCATSSVLSLELEAVNASLMDPWNLPLLRQVSENSGWKLKELALCMGSVENEMDAVFKCLQNFPTLNDLTLRIKNPKITEQINFLRLPNLKNFQFRLGKVMEWNDEFCFIFSLQFLLHCSKLESLMWVTSFIDTVNARNKITEMMDLTKGMIDFKGGYEDLSRSNIWDVFPHLRFAEFEFYDLLLKENYYRRCQCRNVNVK